MRAGFAELEFTPKKGFLPGEFEAYYAKDGALLPLQANAAALSDGNTTVILISADHLQLEAHFATPIRERIAEATGVSFNNILLAATHTHTGPALDTDCWKTPAEPEIAQVVANRIVKAAVEAYENMKDGAAIGVGTTEEKRFSFCRDWVFTDGHIETNPGYGKAAELDHTFATPDYTVEIMKIEQDGKIAAIIVNYADHPDTQWSHERNKFSPDYPGFMRDALKEKYGRDVTVLFLNGCCGDINHLDFKYETDKATYRRSKDVCPSKEIGEGLADTVSAELDKIIADESDVRIETGKKTITVNRRQITDEELAWAHDIMKQSETEYLGVSTYGTAKAYLRLCKDVPETEELSMYLFKIGPWAIVTLPGEIYSEIGHGIKAGSPFERTVLSSLTNGHHGYVTPDYIRGNGSYEGRFSSGTTGYGTAEAMVKGAIELLNEHK